MRRYDVVIIGAGLSGICAAIKLKQAGITNFHVFEKAEDMGGTWRDNRYPGVACDVPSHLYSYSFAPNPDWSRWYAPGAEIHNYIKDCASQFDVVGHITFGTAVLSATWQDDHWVLQPAGSEPCTAKSIITALGGLHTPNVPAISGSDEFAGVMFHTTNWQHDLDLTGKRVGIVGTGATAVQVVPEIADAVAQLVVFQRNPVWVGRKHDPEYTEEEKENFRRNPASIKNHRMELWQDWESMSIELHKPGTRINMAAEARAREQIERSVSDPQVAATLTPDHNFTCKRPTISNRYYATFDKPNVQLVSGSVDAMTKSGVIVNGQHFDLDVVVMATGFKPFDITTEINLTGVNGLSLADAWSQQINSYKTVMVHDFPNLFMMMGPNGTGLQSALQSIEQQCAYAVRAIGRMQDENIASLNPKMEHVQEFARNVAERFKSTTHGKGCSSWWTDDTGINHSIWPSSTVEYRLLLTDVDLTEFEVTRSKEANHGQ